MHRYVGEEHYADGHIGLERDGRALRCRLVQRRPDLSGGYPGRDAELLVQVEACRVSRSAKRAEDGGRVGRRGDRLAENAASAGKTKRAR